MVNSDSQFQKSKENEGVKVDKLGVDVQGKWPHLKHDKWFIYGLGTSTLCSLART